MPITENWRNLMKMTPSLNPPLDSSHPWKDRHIRLKVLTSSNLVGGYYSKGWFKFKNFTCLPGHYIINVCGWILWPVFVFQSWIILKQRQWWIQDFPGEGNLLLPFLYGEERAVRILHEGFLVLQFFCWKLYDNERIWTERRHPWCPPWIRHWEVTNFFRIWILFALYFSASHIQRYSGLICGF